MSTSAKTDNMNGERAIHLIVFDGFADWEPAYALAELRRWGKRTVRTIGFTRAPVTSMGGLRVTPDLELREAQPAEIELLFVPGGDIWETADYPRAMLDALLATLAAAETPIAAICAGTLALGRAGVLNDRAHTSNLRSYLPKHVPNYAGGTYYVDAPAVRDQRVITASGLAPVDFARQIFAELS
ncbi:MAG: type 1 glutamine amidotransferase family protein, partial [bacterium]